MSFRNSSVVLISGAMMLFLSSLGLWAVERPALVPLPMKLEWREGRTSAGVRFEQSAEIPEEGYEIEIAEGGAVVKSSSAAGAFYAAETLKQLRAANGSLPCVAIRDAPRFGWRGFMLDSSRHFQSVEEIKRWLDLLAMHKLNVFHWHLVDDHGWRFESLKYPLLTQVGAWREQPPIGRYGGFYTQAEMREVVAYAAARNITVVPEIEMPGHSRAALAAYPNLACGGKRTEVDRFFDFPMRAKTFPKVPGNNVFCAGREDAFRFVEDILTEVMAIFPSRYIHVGGDEVSMEYWNGCADCQARMKANQLADAHKLQAYFMGRAEAFLSRNGRRLIGWDEIIEGGLSPSATVMSWRGTAGGVLAAKSGHDAVMCPEKPLYFDHRQSSSPTHPPGFGAAIETLREVYDYEPVPKQLTAEEGKHILGVQANLWSCATETEARLQLFAFPRMCALAEVAWGPRTGRDYDGFQKRLTGHLWRLEAMGVNYWKESVQFQVGDWSPSPALKEGMTMDLPLKQVLSAGRWSVSYQYQKGADALSIKEVELLADGVVIAKDTHEGIAGAEHKGHRYTLDVPEMKGGATLVLRTKVHVTPWAGGGNGDSTGAISMAKEESVKVFASEVPLPAIRATLPVGGEKPEWMALHQQLLERNKTRKAEVVVIGDSVARGDGGENLWKAVFGERVVTNLGFAGDSTRQVLWRIDHGELDGISPKQVIVMAGMENLIGGDKESDVVDGIDAICRKIHGKLPEARILVVGLLPRTFPERSVDKVNFLLQTRLHPRTYIDVIDVGNKLRNAEGMPDGKMLADHLHPNDEGYKVIGSAVSVWMEAERRR